MSAKEGTFEIFQLRVGKQVFPLMPIAMDWKCSYCWWDTFSNESEFIGQEYYDQFSDVCPRMGLSLGSREV